MFGKQSRNDRAAHIVADAWDHLGSTVGSTMDSAEDRARTATKRARKAYGTTSRRVGSGSREARERAVDAYEALLGRRRKSGTHWGWLAMMGLAGAVVGWAATTIGQRRIAGPDASDLADSDLAEDFIAATRN